MTAARKVYTEAMIRKVLKAHFEVEPEGVPLSEYESACYCGWSNSPGSKGDAFENHFIDQLHKLWHEMFSRPKSSPISKDMELKSQPL